MNSTDEAKLAIRKMFVQPIDEVDEAFNWVTEEYVETPVDMYDLGLALDELQRKIDNLKSVLPTIQG